MAIYGYHRTSTTEQHLDRGIYEINKFCEAQKIELIDIFTDKQTGKNFNRPEYQFLRKRIRPEDSLIIAELDRLGRKKADILEELRYYKERGVRVMILEIPTTLMDLSGLDNALAQLIMESLNNMLIEMYAVFAQAEMEKKEKRQREGIQAKKLRGEWDDYGRPLAIHFEKFTEAYKKVEAGELKPTECRKLLNLKHATYYRYRDKYLKKEDSYNNTYKKNAKLTIH